MYHKTTVSKNKREHVLILYFCLALHALSVLHIGSSERTFCARTCRFIKLSYLNVHILNVSLFEKSTCICLHICNLVQNILFFIYTISMSRAHII